jgi:hypothetical protein
MPRHFGAVYNLYTRIVVSLTLCKSGWSLLAGESAAALVEVSFEEEIYVSYST